MLYSASALLPLQQLLHFRKRNCHTPGGFQPIALFISFFATLPFCVSFSFFFFHPPEPSRQKVVPAEAGGWGRGGKRNCLLGLDFIWVPLSPPLLPCAARRGGMNAEPVSSELRAAEREEKSRALGMETHFCSEGWLLSLCLCVCCGWAFSACQSSFPRLLPSRPACLVGQELPACPAAVPCAAPEPVAGAPPAWASPRWPRVGTFGGGRMGGGKRRNE